MPAARGAQVDLPANSGGPLAALFAEELGLLLEVAPEHEEEVASAYRSAGLTVSAIGSVAADSSISIAVGGNPHISGSQISLTLRFGVDRFSFDQSDQFSVACCSASRSSPFDRCMLSFCFDSLLSRPPDGSESSFVAAWFWLMRHRCMRR
jgi:hypothetical protein